jgi:glycosyltransferase involved in cell wall biosynthesis
LRLQGWLRLISIYKQFLIRAFNPSIKIVLHTHDEWLNQLDMTMLNKRLARVDLVVGCSEYLTRKVRDRFPWLANRCKTIFNGVDTVRFSKPIDGRSETRHYQKLLFVGRVSPEKGLHVLLEAFKEVVKRSPDVQLDIIGPESVALPGLFINLSNDRRVRALRQFYSGTRYFSQLKDRLSEEIKERVFFTERFIEQSALVHYYLDADLLINPSFVESFGMCLLEAMATELPVIATRIGGMPEVVEDGETGLLVEPNDVTALASAILFLLKDQESRRSMGHAGRQRALETFSWEQTTKNLFLLYQNICSVPSPPSLKS